MIKKPSKFLQFVLVLSMLFSSVGQVAAAPSALASAEASSPAVVQRPNRLVQLSTPQGREQALPLDELSASGLNGVGWTTILADSFDSFPTGWDTYSGSVDQTWGATTVNADTDYNPDSLNSVWPAAGGAAAVDPVSGDYPADLESWMISGPLDLSTWKAAELDFSANYDIEAGDWLGVCAATFASAPTPGDFDQDANCSWLSGTTDGWEYDYQDLTGYVGSANVYVAFVFQSDASNAEPYFGAFIDEVEVWVNDTKVDPTDPNNEFVDWSTLVDDSFDTVALTSDPMWKLETPVDGSAWVTTTLTNDTSVNPTSTTSLSPTPDYSYSAGEKSWMFYGPVDLSNQVEADLFYTANYNLMYSDDNDASNDDWMAFCAIAADKPLTDVSSADVNYGNCDWWSGSSDDYWEEGFFDLTPFAGRSQVYLAWYFESNNANADGGVFVDDLFIEGQSKDAVVPPAVDFQAGGLGLTNGDFANGLTGWQKETPADKSGDAAVVEGQAAITGNQLLIQDFNVVTTTVSLDIHFSYAVATTETVEQTDGFCVSLTPTDDHSTILADIGCWDANDVPEFARDGATRDTFGYTIPQSQMGSLRGHALSLVIELSQNDSQPTTLYLDNVVAYAVGPALRNTKGTGNRSATSTTSEVAAPRDPNEPNGMNTTATPLACNQTKAGVFGDVVGTTNKDFDVFRIDRVPVGPLIVDIDAATLQPASSADSVIYLYNAAFVKIADFDDDGKTLDSLMNYNNTVADATYYVALYNFNTDGAGAFYTVNAKCGQTVAPPAPAPVTPPVQTSSGNKPWTIILFMNGEDQACVTASDPASCWDKATYEKAVQAMEKFIGAKQDVMNVVALIDGPNYGGVGSDVTRFVVQPDGAYTMGVNRWNMDEINMGDPKTFVDFVNWAMANYPADHYYISVDDHGGGADGTSWDHHDVGGKAINDQITPAEMRSAMKQISRDGARKIDIFAFESCLMGLFENAYDLKNYANYIAMFQTISWTALQYPEYFKDLTATDTVEQVGKRIIQTYPIASTGTPYTFGLIQTDRLDAVKTRLDAFATALTGADLATLTTIRNATQAFRGDPEKGDASKDNQGNLDLWDFAQRVKAAGIASAEATALQAAIDGAVIEKKAVLKGRDPVWDYSNYHGLSIIYPKAAYMSLETYCQNYSLSEQGNGSWSKFLTTKVFGQYTWNCSASTAAVQSGRSAQAGLRILRSPVFLEPKPSAAQMIYLPIITN